MVREPVVPPTVADVYPLHMSRTNIDLDDEAVAAVMQRWGLTTKRDAVNFALRELSSRMELDEARTMRGTGWDGDLDEMRGGRVAS